MKQLLILFSVILCLPIAVPRNAIDPNLGKGIDDSNLGSGIDDETVDAFRAIGGTYGGMPTIDDPVFREGKEFAKCRLPGFRFNVCPGRDLPNPKVPFGIDFSNSNIVDADLKHLRQQKALILLDLSDTKISDVGLKKLDGLPLKYLYLHNTNVT